MTLSIDHRKFLLAAVPALLAAVVALMIYLRGTEQEEPGIRQSNDPHLTKAVNINQSQMDTTETDYLKLHSEAVFVDTHNDFMYQVYDKGADISSDNSFTHSDIPKFREGGVDVQVFAVWIPNKQFRNSYRFTLDQIERLKQMAGENSGGMEIAYTYDDIMRIVSLGKLCGLIGIEGGTAIGDDEGRVKEFFDLGVRYIGLTWNNSNLIASSARDETEKGITGGLTDFGRTVIKRMNETGMLIDVSHLGERSFWDVMEISEDPVIASHSNCYSLNPHYRNLTDEQIKAIAEKGGYIGVNFYDKFLVRKGRADIDDVLNHIDHLKKTGGIDCIGIGSDYDGGITPPAGLENVTMYPEITKALLERGYTSDEVKKILGGNFLRVFKKVCG